MITPFDFEKFRLFLEQESGISIGPDKKYLISSRLEKLMKEHGVKTLGELVASRHWFKRVRSLLAGCPSGKDLNITISHRDVSAFVGPKRVNMRRLQELGMRERLKLTTDKSLKRGTMNYVIN
jgi:hypothetical protein